MIVASGSVMSCSLVDLLVLISLVVVGPFSLTFLRGPSLWRERGCNDGRLLGGRV